MKKILIFSPPYNENNGGAICLHKLCHLINELGGSAYLFPSFQNVEMSRINLIIPCLHVLRDFYRRFSSYKTNSIFNTPVVKSCAEIGSWDDWVVVYYEQVFGNPLGAKNIVRWLLHNPGYHTKKIYYGQNELYFKFNEGIKDFTYPGSKLSEFHLKVIHYPLELYNLESDRRRSGIAYCLRKGKGKESGYELKNWTLIDGKTHKEVAEIFKSSEIFVSFDTYTAYSIFAVMCGCKSIVIPDDGVTEGEWYPDERDRYGIAYGFENIDKAESTRSLVSERIISEHNRNAEVVKKFLLEVDEFFNDL